MAELNKSLADMTIVDHAISHNDVTSGQLTFFFIWIGAFGIWILRTLGFQLDFLRNSKDKGETLTTSQNDYVGNGTTDLKSNTNGEQKINMAAVETSDMAADSSKPNNDDKSNVITKNFSAVKPPPTFDEFLKYVVMFGFLMVYFYLCDYRKIFPMLARVYSRDVFLFLVFLLFLVGGYFTLTPTKDKILNRDQTEEWKGWMQVMFVWYHVFAAVEWYNWIRVYIACYVWMTGFGNFSFFWVKKDFSLWRFLKMQFRLNFLVTCLCVVTNNQYMLYYICAMHSYWFITVYVFMGVLKSWNTDSFKMAVKFCAYFLANFIIFEIDTVRDNIFRPLWFILGYDDPRFTLMHEWSFRAGLDHWACFIGMICAYNYPYFESFMEKVESSQQIIRRTFIKIAMVAMAVLTLCLWYYFCMRKDKYAYNEVHPYTSTIPIICFVVIRNAFPVLRQYYIEMFAFLGKITLETYLSQLHVYLQSNAKHLIGYLPDYHLLNFALATLIYLPISYVLFRLTNEFSAYLIPNDLKKVVKNCLTIGIVFGIPYAMLSFMHLL